MRPKLQDEKHFEKEKCVQHGSQVKSKNGANRNEGSVAFDRKSLFDDQISTSTSTCLTRFDHSAYAMIPGKLYKYEDTVESNELNENSCADLFIPYNIALMFLKNTVVEIILGKSRLQKKKFQKALRKLHVWVYEHKRQKWVQLISECDWTHAKLLAQEGSESLRLMYSLPYMPRVAGSSVGSTTVSTAGGHTSKHHQCEDVSFMTDDLSVSGFPGAEDADAVNGRLTRLDCHTPNPPPVSVGSMMMLKNEESASSQASDFFERIPKEQYMANILENRLMKSRYA